ncbi:MAG: Fic/DOC family protein [Candidatus Scalindua sp.]
MKKHGRYQTSHLIEAQYEPGSGKRVLKNLLGIKRKREIDEIESTFLQDAIDKLLGKYDKDHRFIENDIKMIHKLWFGKIYEWAGEYRQVNVSKGEFTFAIAKQIPNLMADFGKISLHKHTPCNFKTQERVIKALSEVHVEFVLIHPFREGNGRAARILSTLMAAQAGLPVLDFTDITGKRRKDYFAAISSGLSRNYKPMEKIFRRIIERSLEG